MGGGWVRLDERGMGSGSAEDGGGEGKAEVGLGAQVSGVEPGESAFCELQGGLNWTHRKH